MQISHIDNFLPLSNVTGVVFAGGRSTRMGSDKAALLIDGQSLFSRVARALGQVCARRQIAGERPDLATKELPAFADTYPGSALGGLHNALEHASTEWVLVLPCDLPCPSPQLLKTLLAHRRQDVQAVIPRTCYGDEPLIACYRRDILPLVEAQLLQQNLRIKDLLKHLQVCYLEEAKLPAGWRRALTNLNRPQDLARLLSPPVVTLVARSGTGKTTLLVKLIAEMTARGWTVGALKHDAHKFEIDHEGKDTWKMAAAGAAMTAISSPTKTAIIQRHELEPQLEQLLAPFTGKVDILLTEGFKKSSLPKIEAHRQELHQPLLCRGEIDDPSLIAVASNTVLHLDVPCFDLNDAKLLADFIEERFLK
ncbi:molybdopterin-guanine dinucleotide biosynthesis protein B [Geopsychrobacter electrodiphilus]|uniref:molybdopterin-guanine dinucleotide biosynthesis protein B n=1 Tax=Geopsychrobacter electrodiphilus TaxID=225196 RepID=UPI0003A28FA2|nr:molybdopterin-guanine dinucleotide biosynthesis protein B [Geopsychrobacter electrodiphilus]